MKGDIATKDDRIKELELNLQTLKNSPYAVGDTVEYCTSQRRSWIHK